MYKELMKKSEECYDKSINYKGRDNLLYTFYYHASMGFFIKAQKLFDKDMIDAMGEIK